VSTLDDLFNGGSVACKSATDINDDGDLNLADGIQLLTYLFSGGTPPAPPFPNCGHDSTYDTLGCYSYDGC
jgi:hypothetical protein